MNPLAARRPVSLSFWCTASLYLTFDFVIAVLNKDGMVWPVHTLHMRQVKNIPHEKKSSLRGSRGKLAQSSTTQLSSSFPTNNQHRQKSLLGVYVSLRNARNSHRHTDNHRPKTLMVDLPKTLLSRQVFSRRLFTCFTHSTYGRSI